MERVDSALPPIPAKRYFTIGEVSELCLVKPYVLRYWEQEFVQLKPMKRRGNRRYYQHHEVLLIRRIRELLYEQGFTISGARNRLSEMGAQSSQVECEDDDALDGMAAGNGFGAGVHPGVLASQAALTATSVTRALQASSPVAVLDAAWAGPDVRALQSLNGDAAASLREALLSIRDLLV
ncbi:MAG: MerR family transcriptional regulator [Aquabacterium sp.]|uniref:MerR family transcriptional regulator n=1 Tax=Aquabacterium sp. TaxID=1872578 RepID=UPI003BD4D5DC